MAAEAQQAAAVAQQAAALATTAPAAAAPPPAAPAAAVPPAAVPSGPTNSAAVGPPPGEPATPGGPPQAAPQAWTQVGRHGARRSPASRSDSESWSPALDPHLWGTSRATALVTDLEIRLVITGIPDYWDPPSVGDFLRSLGFVMACITAVVIKRPVNKPPMAFVNVTDQATADAMIGHSGTKQANSGEPPIMIAAAHKPGVCSACGVAGHTQRKCVQCKHCRAWGHAAVLCPLVQGNRSRSRSPPVGALAVASTSQVPTWQADRALPPDIERALALRGLASPPPNAGPHLPGGPPPPPPAHDFTPTLARTPQPQPESPHQHPPSLAPSPPNAWPRRLLEPALAALDMSAPPTLTPQTGAQAAAPATPATPMSASTPTSGPSRAAARQLLADALRENTREMAMAVEDSPEEEAAALMVALYQRKLRRHDAETTALAGPSPPAPSPQIRRPE